MNRYQQYSNKALGVACSSALYGVGTAHADHFRHWLPSVWWHSALERCPAHLSANRLCDGTGRRRDNSCLADQGLVSVRDGDLVLGLGTN